MVESDSGVIILTDEGLVRRPFYFFDRKNLAGMYTNWKPVRYTEDEDGDWIERW